MLILFFCRELAVLMEIRVPRVSQGQRWVCPAVWMLSYSAANVVFMSCSWVIALFQGDQGQRGVMGEPGPPGEKVRWCINIILSHREKNKTIHWSLGAQFPQTDHTYCWSVVQGGQGPRGITGVPGPKGEPVSYQWWQIKVDVHSEVAK